MKDPFQTEGVLLFPHAGKQGEPLKKYKYFALLFVLFVAISVSTYTVLGAGSRREVVDPEPLATSNLVQDERAPALISIAALYAPIDNHDGWIKQVCAGMT